jgi:hypothetical protein
MKILRETTIAIWQPEAMHSEHLYVCMCVYTGVAMGRCLKLVLTAAVSKQPMADSRKLPGASSSSLLSVAARVS